MHSNRGLISVHNLGKWENSRHVAAQSDESASRPEKVAQIVARAIVRDAFVKDLAPGSTLDPEAKMAARYNVSRSSLREALRILELLGFVRLKPGPGGGPVMTIVEPKKFTDITTFYYHVDRVRYHDLVEARLALEPVMARLAAGRRSPAEVVELEKCLVEMRAVDVEDTEPHVALSREFHSMLAEMSGNPVIALLVGSCVDIIPRHVDFNVYPHEMRRKLVGVHCDIARAVIDGDEALAEQLMAEHMREYLSLADRTFPEAMQSVIEW